MYNKPTLVFIQTAFIGDLFLSLPTLKRLKNKFPGHQIILICKTGLAEIFLKEKFVDYAFEVQKGNPKSYQKVLKQLQPFQIKIVFCPHQSLRSILFASKIKADLKIGFKKWYTFMFFNRTVIYQKKWPDVIRQISILRPIDKNLNSEIEKTDWSYLNIKNTDAGFSKIPDIFEFSGSISRPNQDTVAIFPGSVWQTKQWTTTGFSEVVSKLLQQNKIVLLMGGPAEKNICDQIHLLNPQAVNLTGQCSLYESYLKLKQCNQVICNDSAPAHMAASLGIPVIAIFGPTTVDMGFRPWNNNSKVAEILNLDCRPCGKHGHHRCPKLHHRCMIDLKSDTVIDLLKNNF